MWGKTFAIFAVLALLWAGSAPGQAGAAGEHGEIGKAGRYEGTVTRLQTVRCSSDPGDKRYCKRIYLAVDPGVPLTSRMHLYTEITRKGRLFITAPMRIRAFVEQINSMDRLVNKILKPNTRASVSVSCGDEGCLVDRIDLR